MKVKKVKLYSTMQCPYCRMEKAWLEGNNIEHEVSYVDKNQEEAIEMVKKTGQMGVPVTEILYDDKDPDYIVGFDVGRLSEIFQKNN